MLRVFAPGLAAALALGAAAGPALAEPASIDLRCEVTLTLVGQAIFRDGSNTMSLATVYHFTPAGDAGPAKGSFRDEDGRHAGALYDVVITDQAITFCPDPGCRLEDPRYTHLAHPSRISRPGLLFTSMSGNTYTDRSGPDAMFGAGTCTLVR